MSEPEPSWVVETRVGWKPGLSRSECLNEGMAGSFANGDVVRVVPCDEVREPKTGILGLPPDETAEVGAVLGRPRRGPSPEYECDRVLERDGKVALIVMGSHSGPEEIGCGGLDL